MSAAEAEEMAEDYRRGLDEGKLQGTKALGLIGNKYTVDWSKYRDVDWHEPVRTRVKLDLLRELAARATTFPEGFTLHRQVARIMDDRRKMAAGQLRSTGGSPRRWLTRRCSTKASRFA